MIIGLLNQKGGVGKTTLSLNIAHYLAKQGNHVLVVDADPQQSALTWSEVREIPLPFDVVGMAKKSVHRDLPAFASNYDFTVIDGPPRATELARSCIMASDLVIVPCTPSAYDIWASEETIKLIEEASIYKLNLKGLFVINRKIINTAIAKDAAETLKTLTLPLARNAITQRIMFAETAASGITVFDLEYENKGAKEITMLMEEILSGY